MSNNPIIYWFRDDLRLHDLPALKAAVATGKPVLACYILDDDSPEHWRMGSASRWWLHHSLDALSSAIEALGGRLYLASGCPEQILGALAQDAGASQIYCSRSYEPWAQALERRVEAALENLDVELLCFRGSLLFDPGQVKTQAGTPFKVYTPFWKACRLSIEPDQPVGAAEVKFWNSRKHLGISLPDLALISATEDRAENWQQYWQPGEKGATVRLCEFLDERLALYAQGRDFPGLDATSLLSAHLHFGEISPNKVFHSVRQAVMGHPALDLAAEKFLNELGWREFSRYLLFHFPQVPDKAFKPAFEAFPWVGSVESLAVWKTGHTGYPMVDAGMRELRQTGYMHGRVRMIVASFLCKHLLIDWRVGERWFWDLLVDADLANNACGWQWVAGSGADAAPYFRIFNPITQGKKFDREGTYVRRWVPELAALPDRYLFQPWEAPQSLLEECDVTLGSHYPFPIVEHKPARESALAAYAHIKST
jgi:deoxyribodipyrimidine photo-lyase